MAEKMNGLSLDFIIHPGETLKEVLEEKQMSQEELAIRTGFSPKHVSEVVNGKIYVVFGCTGDRDRIKRPIMTHLVDNLSDYFIITNDDTVCLWNSNKFLDKSSRNL